MDLRCSGCAEMVSVALDSHGRGECPRCAASVLTDRILSIRGEDFQQTVLSAPLPVLVDFFAKWCGPCQWIVPTLEEVARARAGELLVVKVDTDEAPEVAEAWSITSVPTVILFREGREVERSRGVEPERVRGMAEVGGRGPGGGEPAGPNPGAPSPAPESNP
jgi:thioredoxin 2